MEKLLGAKGIEALSITHVAVIGLGSLGGQITEFLAQSTVSHFTLIDKDTISAENIVRHAADLRYLGWPKVDAVKDLIHHRNPQADVMAIQRYAQEAEAEIAKADLVIVAGLGSEAVTRQIANLLRKLEKPAIFAGLFERAVGGDVFYIDPRLDDVPCYACVATLVSDEQPVVEKDINYGMPIDELRAQPGLAPDVSYAAMVASKWALRLLIDDPAVLAPYPGNYFIFANEERIIGTDGQGKPVVQPPATGRWMTIPKRELCLICGGPETPTTSEDIEDLLA